MGIIQKMSLHFLLITIEFQTVDKAGTHETFQVVNCIIHFPTLRKENSQSHVSCRLRLQTRQLYALFETPQLDARLVYCHSNLNHSLTILVVFYYWKQEQRAVWRDCDGYVCSTCLLVLMLFALICLSSSSKLFKYF